MFQCSSKEKCIIWDGLYSLVVSLPARNVVLLQNWRKVEIRNQYQLKLKFSHLPENFPFHTLFQPQLTGDVNSDPYYHLK